MTSADAWMLAYRARHAQPRLRAWHLLCGAAGLLWLACGIGTCAALWH